MSDDNVRDLPSREIDFDLDSLEKDPKNQIPAFKANIGDKVVEFGNPEDVDWQDMVLVENPVEMLQFLVSAEDLKHIREQHLPAWKIGRLVEKLLEHYKFDEKFRDAQREAAQLQRGGR